MNIFGSETEKVTHAAQDQPLPGAPIGHRWRLERLTPDPATG